MTHLIPFPLEHFENYCNTLQRVGVDCGYILYTNHHASNHQPASRMFMAEQMDAVQAYLDTPSDQTFRHLVEIGVFLDTEWDRETKIWQTISFQGWEILHDAFSRLYAKSGESLQELTGLSDLDFVELV